MDQLLFTVIPVLLGGMLALVIFVVVDGLLKRNALKRRKQKESV